MVAVGALLARCNWLGALRYCGENSIVIYLAFFLPMAATRTVLLKTGLIPDIGTVSLVVTTAGVVGALCMCWAVRNTGAQIPVRAAGAVLAGGKPRAASLQAAE